MTSTRLRTDVERLALPEGRTPGTRGHANAKSYLVSRLTELGLDPYGEAFELSYAEHPSLSNLIGVAPGTNRAADPVVIGAHHDTVIGTPGADDNAAAMAIALEVAARLKEKPAERDVLIGLFDGEEPPYFHGAEMGSTHFYKHQRRGPVHAAVVLDLVGHAVPVPGLEDLMFITGMESDPGLERVVTGLEQMGDLKIVTTLNEYVGDMSDHHIFTSFFPAAAGSTTTNPPTLPTSSTTTRWLASPTPSRCWYAGLPTARLRVPGRVTTPRPRT